MTSAPTELYASLNNESDIKKLCEERAVEDLYLEFKSKRTRSVSTLEDDDRKNFSRCMSGFSNADGGVLIWGIKTKRQDDGLDVADRLLPIANAADFCARLRSSVLQTTQPVVDGVALEVIPAAETIEGVSAGYVKCLIPASDMPPHRAMVGGQYWRRTSHGQREMEHYELEDVFGRRLRPNVRITTRLVIRPDGDPHEEIQYKLVNIGRGIARHAGFFSKFFAEQMTIVQTTESIKNVTSVNNKPAVCWDLNAQVIHPNNIEMMAGSVVILRPPELRGTSFQAETTCYAENMKMKRMMHPIFPFADGTF